MQQLFEVALAAAASKAEKDMVQEVHELVWYPREKREGENSQALKIRNRRKKSKQLSSDITKYFDAMIKARPKGPDPGAVASGSSSVLPASSSGASSSSAPASARDLESSERAAELAAKTDVQKKIVAGVKALQRWPRRCDNDYLDEASESRQEEHALATAIKNNKAKLPKAVIDYLKERKKADAQKVLYDIRAQMRRRGFPQGRPKHGDWANLGAAEVHREALQRHFDAEAERLAVLNSLNDTLEKAEEAEKRT